MIYLDTNILLRFLVVPETPLDIESNAIAAELFASVERGEVQITTSEVVLHEFCGVMTSRAQYGRTVTETISKLRPLFSLPGFRFPSGDKAIYLRALDIYEANPKLEFADSVIAARAERLGVPLATFDERLGKLPFLTRWQPQN